MNTKLISDKALEVIDQYMNFAVGGIKLNIPYFNNRNLGAKGQFKVYVGKGSPKDIFDEIESLAILEKVDIKKITSEDLKKFLVAHDIGIDCSGLAYHILNAENESRGKGSLDKHLHYPLCKGLMGKIRCKIRPIENTGVATIAHDKNSKILNITQAEPGDIITMIGKKDSGTNDVQRDHILVIHQIEYQNFMPTTLHYTHAIAWPTDGEYGHGVRQGKIEVVNPIVPITEQRWIEKEQEGNRNYTLARAQKSVTELRRLNWF